jgi:hypothetical protein
MGRGKAMGMALVRLVRLVERRNPHLAVSGASLVSVSLEATGMNMCCRRKHICHHSYSILLLMLMLLLMLLLMLQ